MEYVKKSPQINESFTNRYGVKLDKVREIAYKSGELFGNLGKPVVETKASSSCYLEDTKNSTNGVIIYQTFTDPNVAYRIYRAYADYGFNGYFDDRLIYLLQKKQPNIKCSKFPTGVVTLDGNIIGQEIPFFPNHITILELFEKYKNIDPTKIYYAILEVLNELEHNGILYLDIHAKNFLIDPTNTNINIELIDYDYSQILFDPNIKSGRYSMFENYNYMINRLNKLSGIDELVGKMDSVQNFDEAYKQLDIMKRSLHKK